MKKFLVLFAICLSLISCSITEKLIIKENFETEFKFGFDMSPILKLDNKKKTDKKEYKKIDSTFSFSELIKNMPQDSIAKMTNGDAEKLELLKKMNFQLNVDEENKIFNYEIGFKIANINDHSLFPKSDEISSLLMKTDKSFGDLSSLNKNETEEEKSETKYSYDGKIFSKTTINKKDIETKSIGKADKPEKKKKKSKKDDFAQFGEKVDEVLKECKYKMEYHFPKTIKTVSVKGAVISEDKKSFTCEIPFEEYDKDKNLDFEVVFE